MPTYEYKCDSGHEFEVQQNIKEKAIIVCPKTGVDHNGEEVVCCSPCRRLISKSSFVLKGSGWTPKGGI